MSLSLTLHILRNETTDKTRKIEKKREGKHVNCTVCGCQAANENAFQYRSFVLRKVHYTYQYTRSTICAWSERIDSMNNTSTNPPTHAHQLRMNCVYVLCIWLSVCLSVRRIVHLCECVRACVGCRDQQFVHIRSAHTYTSECMREQFCIYTIFFRIRCVF